MSAEPVDLKRSQGNKFPHSWAVSFTPITNIVTCASRLPLYRFYSSSRLSVNRANTNIKRKFNVISQHLTFSKVLYLAHSLLKSKRGPWKAKPILPSTESMQSGGYAWLRGKQSRCLTWVKLLLIYYKLIEWIIWFLSLWQINIRNLQSGQLIKEAISESQWFKNRDRKNDKKQREEFFSWRTWGHIWISPRSNTEFLVETGASRQR